MPMYACYFLARKVDPARQSPHSLLIVLSEISSEISYLLTPYRPIDVFCLSSLSPRDLDWVVEIAGEFMNYIAKHILF